MPIDSYQLIKGQKPNLHRAAVEVRFARSGRFYSELGSLVQTLESDYPEWLLGPDPVSAHTVSYISIKDGIESVLSDISYRLVLSGKSDRTSYDASDMLEFSRACARIADLYESRVRPTETNRVGYREWWYFYFDNEDEAQAWLLELGLFNVPQELVGEFGAVSKSGWVAVFDQEEFATRVAVNVVEIPAMIEREDQVSRIQAHQLSKNQREKLAESERQTASRIRMGRKYAAVMDFDAYQDYPPSTPDIGRFVQDRNKELLGKMRSVIGGGHS